MSANISDDAVPLLRAASVAVFLGFAEDLRFEFIDSVEDGHPALLDCLDAQSEIGTEFRVRLPGERGSEETLFSRTQTQYRLLVTIHSGGNRVRRGDDTLPRHNNQSAVGVLEFRHHPVGSCGTRERNL